eukprot:4517124-Amphidinium_carterae.1
MRLVRIKSHCVVIARMHPTHSCLARSNAHDLVAHKAPENIEVVVPTGCLEAFARTPLIPTQLRDCTTRLPGVRQKIGRNCCWRLPPPVFCLDPMFCLVALGRGRETDTLLASLVLLLRLGSSVLELMVRHGCDYVWSLGSHRSMLTIRTSPCSCQLQ